MPEESRSGSLISLSYAYDKLLRLILSPSLVVSIEGLKENSLAYAIWFSKQACSGTPVIRKVQTASTGISSKGDRLIDSMN